MVRIKIESCESGEVYVIDGESIPEVVVKCITDITSLSTDHGSLELPSGMANLLETIGEAMRKHDNGEPPIARCWDFSSPEEAFYVMFFEDSEDDDGTDCATVWANVDRGLDRAVRDIVSPGWDRVEA